MLEGSFRPSSSASTVPSYGIAKSGFNDQSAAVTNMRRREPPASSFAPAHDRHLSEYEPEGHQQLASPPGPRYFKTTQQSHLLSPHTQSTQVTVHQSVADVAQPTLLSKNQEPPPKNSSIGPMRAKKKPAGTACNSCHRLKTRCSGGHPCDRCAAHKVPCQFDRDLIYRSPLASSSQQASVRSAHGTSRAESGATSKSRSRGGAKTARKASTASAAPVVSAPAPSVPQSASTTPVLPISLPQAIRLSSPSIPVPSAPTLHQPSPLPNVNTKLGHRSTPVSTPALSETFVSYEPNLPQSNGLHLRLAALESSVSGLLQVLRAQQVANSGLFVPAPEHRAPLSPPAPPTLVMTGSSSTFGPEKDHAGDHYRIGNPNSSCPIGDPLSKGILSSTQLQYLYDVFVEFCLPNLPILHNVQMALIRARSSFLFTVMVTVGARFCSSQSVAHIPPKSQRPNSTAAKVDLSQMMIDEQTYARLVALAHLHLSATLLKATHSLEDVRAILFLACWALVSNEDPNGTPNRWVLIGHAGRIGRSIGLDRCAHELHGCNGIWGNPEIHEARCEQLDAIKTDEALRAVETILSSNLRLEPSRNYFPPLHMPTQRDSHSSIVKLSAGSPHQYDIVSAAQIEALAELAEIWAAVNSFLSVADDRSRSLNGEQLIELGERHNHTMDAWAKKWTWQGSSWAPLLGVNLRTIRLLSESLRITLNLAFTNVLYAITAVSKPAPIRFQEALATALERVSGSSAAVIQAHRDSVREGFSLAFAPDLVTDGLVSAAITVLQLASPIGLTPIPGKSVPKETAKGAPNQSVASSNTVTLVNEDSHLTPHSREDIGDDETRETNVSNTDMVYFHQSNPHKDLTRDSRSSSPSSTPSRLSKSSSPRGNAPLSLFADTSSAGGPTIGKKSFMEPPVAAHYIRMATDVLQASDRSQTRLGTIMASKIMKLAAQAGLISPMNSSNSNIVHIIHAANSTSDTTVPRDDRPSISSTSSLSSARNVEVCKDENHGRHPYCKTDAHQRDDTPDHSDQVEQDEDEEDLIDDELPQTSQGPLNNATVLSHPLAGREEAPTKPKEDGSEGDNDASPRDAQYSEEHQSTFSLEKRSSDMMDEDH